MFNQTLFSSFFCLYLFLSLESHAQTRIRLRPPLLQYKDSRTLQGGKYLTLKYVMTSFLIINRAIQGFGMSSNVNNFIDIQFSKTL